MAEMEVMGHAVERHPDVGWIPQGSKATTEYCLEYTHNGTRWAMNFFAEDAEDAAQKVQSVRNSLTLLGTFEMRIPWNPET